MPAKQSSSKSTERSQRVTHRGKRPGDKTVNRQKHRTAPPKIKVGDDLLSAIERKSRLRPPGHRPRPAQEIYRIRRELYDLTGQKIAKVAVREGWTAKEKIAAVRFIRSLCYTTDVGIPAMIAQASTKRVRARVQYEFTYTMWRRRAQRQDIDFPGMSQPWFSDEYAKIQQRPLATSQAA